MRQILLTSAGLTDSLKLLFFERIGKNAEEIKILLIPTAAVQSDPAREGIRVCIYELLGMGISDGNITVCELTHLLSDGYERTYSGYAADVPARFRAMTSEELLRYDAAVFCGGDAGFLLSEMNRTGFDRTVTRAVEQGLFYLGISAGSMIAAGNFETGLRLIKNPVVVHSDTGTPCGSVQCGEIHLTDSRAVFITDSSAEIIE